MTTPQGMLPTLPDDDAFFTPDLDRQPADREKNMSEQDHKTIWLQPWCDGCEKNAYGSDGRQWCEDDVWGKCDECEQKSVQYTLCAIPQQKTWDEIEAENREIWNPEKQFICLP